jgi:hypothetical protein
MARTAKSKSAKNTKATKEVSAAIKTFKASSEVENFYRYIHENGLRNEARTLVEMVLTHLKGSKKRKRVLQ